MCILFGRALSCITRHQQGKALEPDTVECTPDSGWERERDQPVIFKVQMQRALGVLPVKQIRHLLPLGILSG